MTHELVSQLMARFETDHKVDGYVVEGVNVWPILRMHLGIGVLDERNSSLGNRPAATTPRGALVARSRRIALRVFRLLRNVYRLLAASLPSGMRFENRWPPPAAGRTAAIVGQSDRAIRWGDVWIHTIADPLADLLESEGWSPVLWELGKSPGTRIHPATSLRELHKHRYNLASRTLPLRLEKPPWFGEVAEFCQNHLGFRWGWSEPEATIRHVLVLARVFEAWMREVNCGAVFLDCWFTSHALAASLAASRLGIPSVDYQHGARGEKNLGYSSWMHAPKSGYEVMPDFFWVWGRHEAEAILEENDPSVCSPEKILLGGNLWLDRWRGASDAEIDSLTRAAGLLCDGSSRSILVTLQLPVIAIPDWLPDAVRNSPKDWRWLIRLHRRDRVSLPEVERTFLNLDHPGVEIRQATDLPLYAWLQNVDIHVTGYSTCALEALAFGVPSILTHPSADAMYQRYIRQGVMLRCDSADPFIRTIESGFLVSREKVLAASEEAFASVAAAADAMEKLTGTARRQSA